jgi:hypothetical protein
MARVSNNKARDYVNGLHEFQGSNMFGKWIPQGGGRTMITKCMQFIVMVHTFLCMYTMQRTEVDR